MMLWAGPESWSDVVLGVFVGIGLVLVAISGVLCLVEFFSSVANKSNERFEKS